MLFNTMIRVESYHLLHEHSLRVVLTQVLHGCRQFVPLGVWLTPINERNPRYYLSYNNLTSIRSFGDYDKPSWPLWGG